jgi:hypothetical protein
VASFSGSAEAGVHEIDWEAGNIVASGVYLYRLVADNGHFVANKKMVLLK